MLTLCSPADIYWCFNKTCTFCYPQLKAADSDKMTVNFCQTVWCHVPEDTGVTKLEMYITGQWKILYIMSTNIQWKSTTIKVTIVWRPVIKTNNCYSQICILQHIHTSHSELNIEVFKFISSQAVRTWDSKKELRSRGQNWNCRQIMLVNDKLVQQQEITTQVL